MVAVLGPETEVVCAVSHSGIGEAAVILSAQVSALGMVKVFALAVEEVGDILHLNGTLTVIVRGASML